MNEVATAVAPRTLYSAMIAGIAMMTAVLWMPATLGALAQAYGLATPSLSGLAFAELTGFLLGTLFASGRTLGQLRRWIPIGCVLIVLSAAWFMLTSDRAPFVGGRLIAGFGSGIGFGFGLKACAASARPTRSFGIFTASMSLMMVIGFQFLALLTDSAGTVGGDIQPDLMKGVAARVFGIYGAVATIAALIVWLSRSQVRRPDEPPASRQFALPDTTVMIGLLAICLAFIGQGGIWAFLQVLGVSHGFNVGGVANAMSAFAIAGIAGSLGAATVPLRWPRTAAIAAALIVLWVGLYALYRPVSLAWYVAGCAVGGFYWNFMLPLTLGLLARIDVTGRGAVLGGTMSSAGSALGPLLAGHLIRDADYRPAGWMAGALCLASLICVWAIERRSALKYARVPTMPA